MWKLSNRTIWQTHGQWAWHRAATILFFPFSVDRGTTHQAIIIKMIRCVTFPNTTSPTDTKPVNPKWKSKSKSQAVSHLYEYKSIWKIRRLHYLWSDLSKCIIGNSRKMFATCDHSFIHSHVHEKKSLIEPIIKFDLGSFFFLFLLRCC